MKKAINYWSFPGGLTGEKPVIEAMKEAKEAGFKAIELALFSEGEIALDSKKKEIAAFKREADNIGIEICSLATDLLWDYLLTASDPAIRQQAKKIVKKELEIASWLEVQSILVIPGAVDVFFKENSEIVPYEIAYERSLRALKELGREAEKFEVHLGIENVWNKFLLSPIEMRDFIDEIGNPFVNVYFDVGNVMLFGYPEQWIEILGKERIRNVHIKDYKKKGFDGSVGPVDGFAEIGDGDVNWNKVIRTLDKISFRDYLVAEMVPPTSNLETEGIIARTSNAMDRILDKGS